MALRREVRRPSTRPAAWDPAQLHRAFPCAHGLATVVVAAVIRARLLRRLPSSSSSFLSWFFGPSLQPRYRPSALLRPLLTSLPLSWKRSPQVRYRICPLAPPGSTGCVWMIFGLCCSGPACRPRPASLPVRLPTVESLLRASFSFASRLRLAFRYGCHHRLRLAPFIQLDSAHAGHTPRPTPSSAFCTLA